MNLVRLAAVEFIDLKTSFPKLSPQADETTRTEIHRMAGAAQTAALRVRLPLCNSFARPAV
jgi:hypothetical protein